MADALPPYTVDTDADSAGHVSAAAFCEVDTTVCTWRGDWHYESDFEGLSSDREDKVFQAAHDDGIEHVERTHPVAVTW